MTDVEEATGKFIAHLQERIASITDERDAARQENKDLSDQLKKAKSQLALYEDNPEEFAKAVKRLRRYHEQDGAS